VHIYIYKLYSNASFGNISQRTNGCNNNVYNTYESRYCTAIISERDNNSTTESNWLKNEYIKSDAITFGMLRNNVSSGEIDLRVSYRPTRRFGGEIVFKRSLTRGFAHRPKRREHAVHFGFRIIHYVLSTPRTKSNVRKFAPTEYLSIGPNVLFLFNE